MSIYGNKINESYIISGKDEYINMDKFFSGESNVLLITGLSGSGKTTLARKFSNKYHINWLQLDALANYAQGMLDLKYVKKYEPGLYEYINSRNIKYGDRDAFDEYYFGFYRDYIHFLIDWCKSQDKKFIIEGLQIYWIYEKGDKFILDNPIIIKGTSVLTSTIRGVKRDNKEDNITNPIKKMDEYIDRGKYLAKHHKYYEQFKRDLMSLK